jgi:hypothetical protein
MVKLQTYQDFVNESLQIKTEKEAMNEMAKELQTLAKSSSKSEFRKKLKDKLEKTSPTLADDDNFIDQLADSFSSTEGAE